MPESLDERRLALDERKQDLDESWPKKWGGVVVGASATIMAALISGTFAYYQHDADAKLQAAEAYDKSQIEAIASFRVQQQQEVEDDRQAAQLYFQYMANDVDSDPKRLDKLRLISNVAHNKQLLQDIILPTISQGRSEGDAPSAAARNLPNLIPEKAEYGFGDFVGYVQYDRGDDAAKAIADRLESAIQGLGMTAPGIQGVQSVPNVNQIRIYKPAHRPLAQQLAQSLSKAGLGGYCVAPVANPSTLPNGIVELWIGKAPFAGTPGANC